MKPDLDAMEARGEAAHKLVCDLCRPRGAAGAREWMMSIPARPEYDPDLVIGAALSDIPALIAYVRKLEAVAEAARSAATQKLFDDAGHADDLAVIAAKCKLQDAIAALDAPDG